MNKVFKTTSTLRCSVISYDYIIFKCSARSTQVNNICYLVTVQFFNILGIWFLVMILRYFERPKKNSGEILMKLQDFDNESMF